MSYFPESSFVSVVNSSEALLGIGGVFTGVAEDILGLFQRRDNYGCHSQGGTVNRRYLAPMAPEKTDIRVDALAGSPNNEVTCSFNLLLIAN